MPFDQVRFCIRREKRKRGIQWYNDVCMAADRDQDQHQQQDMAAVRAAKKELRKVLKERLASVEKDVVAAQCMFSFLPLRSSGPL